MLQGHCKHLIVCPLIAGFVRVSDGLKLNATAQVYLLVITRADDIALANIAKVKQIS